MKKQSAVSATGPGGPAKQFGGSSEQSTKSSQAAYEVTSSSVEDTHALGERIGRALRAGDVVALCGELGSGKTTLIQGVAAGLGRDPAGIKSPTFVLMREYPGTVPLVHIDAYRLAGAPAASWLDVDLMFSPQKITLIEWAERFEDTLPAEHLTIQLAHVSAHRRRITLTASGHRADDMIEQLKTSDSRLQTQDSGIGSPEEGHDPTTC